MTRAADLADLGSAYGGYNGFGFRNALISGGTQSMGLNVSGTYSSAGLQYGAATTGSFDFSAELF